MKISARNQKRKAAAKKKAKRKASAPSAGPFADALLGLMPSAGPFADALLGLMLQEHGGQMDDVGVLSDLMLEGLVLANAADLPMKMSAYNQKIRAAGKKKAKTKAAGKYYCCSSAPSAGPFADVLLGLVLQEHGGQMDDVLFELMQRYCCCDPVLNSLTMTLRDRRFAAAVQKEGKGKVVLEDKAVIMKSYDNIVLFIYGFLQDCGGSIDYTSFEWTLHHFGCHPGPSLLAKLIREDPALSQIGKGCKSQVFFNLHDLTLEDALKDYWKNQNPVATEGTHIEVEWPMESEGRPVFQKFEGIIQKVEKKKTDKRGSMHKYTIDFFDGDTRATRLLHLKYSIKGDSYDRN